MKPSPKSLIELPDGSYGLLRAGNMADKRAAGKCIIKWCRNRLPESAIRKRNSVCSKCAMRRWRANNPLGAMLLLWRNRARVKRVPFDLTVSGMAEFLNGSGYLDLKGRHRGMYHLDRIVPRLGYVFSNIQVLSAEDNCSKSGKEKKVYGAEEPDPF